MSNDPSLTAWEEQANAVERKNDELARDQWKLIRDHVHVNTQRLSAVVQDIEALKKLFTSFQGDTKEFQHGMTNRVDKVIVDMTKDHEDEKLARTTKLSLVDRQLVEIIDRLDARDDSDETARQRTDLSISSAKKEGKELVDAAVERINSLESAVSTQIPAAMADLKTANQKMRETMMLQLDALKESHEIHKAASADVVSLERKAREDALADLQTNVNRRLHEEKAGNENRRNLLKESFEAGIASEKQDRDACIKNVQEQLATERSKRKEGDDALKELIASNIGEEKNSRESAHGDLLLVLNREKAEREAHHSSMQASMNEERAAREAHANDMHRLHNDAKNDHKDHVEQQVAKERSLRDASLADMKELLSGHHDHFSSLAERESANRAAHLQEKLDAEAQSREKMMQQMFDKCRAEGDAVLQGKIDAEAKVRESSVTALKEKIEKEIATRGAEVGQLQEIIGAERKTREDNHKNFAVRMKEHQDEVGTVRDQLHGKLDKDREERNAHHNAFHEHVKGLFDDEKDARGGVHNKLASEIENLKGQFGTEAKVREETVAELRKYLSLLEDVIGDGSELESSNASKSSRATIRGSVAPVVKREMLPLSRRFKLLEEKILMDVERESAEREAHGSEIKELIALESQRREEYHGNLTEQLGTLHGRHGDLQSLLDKERAERAAHLDAHGQERDALHSRLQDRLDEMNGKHDNHRNAHMTFQETVNQMLAEEVAKLEDLVATENKTILELTHSVKDEMDAVKRELSDGLAKEGAMREVNDTNLREVLCRRMEYLEVVLDGADDCQSTAGGLRSPGFPMGGGSVANAFTRRVVTLQQRLDGLENRLRGDLAKEANTRESENSKLSDLLDEETKSRKDLDSSVKSRVERERALIEARIKDDSDKVGREIEALRRTNSKTMSELDQRGKMLETVVERETSGLKQAIEEEKGQRLTADKAIERTLVTLTERFNAEEANNETNRQRIDLAMMGNKKDTKEKHDLAIDRIGAVENHVHEVLPAVVTELRDADHKTHQILKEQIDGVKAVQETQRNSVSEMLASEKAQREETVRDLHSHINSRLSEERTHRDGRETVLQDTMRNKLQEEKEDRDAGHRAINQALAAERTKRETVLASVQEACEASVADSRRDSDAKHSEMRTQLDREREAREAHRALVQSMHDETQKAKEAHAREVNKSLDSHRQEHKAVIDKEAGILRSNTKDAHDRIDEMQRSLKRGLDEETKTREEEINGLNLNLESEKIAREAQINKNKSEQYTLLKEEVETIRKEVTNSLTEIDSKREDGYNGVKEKIFATMKRVTAIEGCLSDTSSTNTLLTVSRELDDIEKKFRAEIAKEVALRDSGDTSLRTLIDEEVQWRKAMDTEVKTNIQKETSERDRAVKDSAAKMKAAIVSKLQLL